MTPVKVLAVQYLSAVTPELSKALGTDAPCLGLLTTDSDDPTYIALDQATKDAQVTVCYGRSFYAGAGNASTPFAGEVIGILAGPTPGAVRSGMESALGELERVGFEDLSGIPCLAHKRIALIGKTVSVVTVCFRVSFTVVCNCARKLCINLAGSVPGAA